MAISGSTRVVGVWGCPVKHSLSPIMQNSALQILGLDWIYVPFTVDPNYVAEAVNAVRALDLIGVNVTVPLKELIVPLLDWIDPDAAGINSVNTIVNKDGELRGYSTDGAGLLWDLEGKGFLPKHGSSILVLGAGGSARSVVRTLTVAGFPVSVANRTAERAKKLAAELKADITLIDWSAEALTKEAGKSALVVNTTSLGMQYEEFSPESIFKPGCIARGQTLYDLVYSPPVTPLMRFAHEGGAEACNGIGMLVRQGALSLKLWTGLSVEELPIKAMEDSIEKHLKNSSK